MRLTPEKRLAILDEVFQSGQKVSAVCRKWGISRFTFYKWAKFWRPATNFRRKLLVSDRVARGSKHLRAIGGKRQKLILECVLKNPEWSSHQIANFLKGFKDGSCAVSNHGVYNVLKKYALNERFAREEFSRKHITRSVFPSKFTDFEKYKVISEFNKGRKIAEICKQLHISRFTFYAWLKKYELERTVSSLADRRMRGEAHPRSLSDTVRKQVLATVAQNPDYSVHKLHAALASTVGHHGIQNILERENLNTISRRQSYAEGLVQKPKVAVAGPYVPEVPLWRLRQILAPFVTIPKLLFTSPVRGLLATLLAFLPIFLFILWVKLVVSAPAGTSRPGLVFATVALFFGLFFFLYSLKYYLTILMILRFATQGAEDKSGDAKASPLHINFDRVKLDFQKPFVSIHVALYNEKSVVERLIRACTSQDWYVTGDTGHETRSPDKRVAGDVLRVANYELVIVDDSTDETTEMARQCLVAGSWLLVKTEKDEEKEIFIYQAPVTSYQLPIVKLIHRASRSGFKGGALQEALRASSPQAEYICVFDADFIPYPDTIEQFIKTFQVLSESSDEGLGASENNSLDARHYTLDSNKIAAVQGYQWHVLNKSQTWVTRGVRTEYAGSYVIERSGAQLYGGLKQIAGAVYAIRADVLRAFGWGTSITEDFELTLRLYEAGYKVAFTPYIQAPAEAVSTIRRLIRQRMRWAEGASFNVKVMFKRMLFGRWEAATANSSTPGVKELYTPGVSLGGEGKVWVPSRLTLAEKLEFAYLAPYYLQAAFLVIGTLSWFISEAILGSRLPFWTAALGWSLVATNLLALPLMNIIGLFLEESDERDYLGAFSFIALSYIVVPFQAYAAIKGFLERSEGPWFRTPKTGAITDVLERSGFGKFFGQLIGGKPAVVHANEMRIDSALRSSQAVGLGRTLAHSFRFADIGINSRIPIKPRQVRWISNLALGVIIAVTVLMSIFAPLVPVTTSYASQPTLKTVEQTKNGEGTKRDPPSHEASEGDEITTPRAIERTTRGGKKVQFIFHEEPRVRVKLGDPTSQDASRGELEFETKTVFGQKANPTKSRIYQDKEVVYREIVKDVDLKYTVAKNQLVEEFIIKTRNEKLETGNLQIEQVVKTVDVKVISPSPGLFGFYSDDGEEIFKFSQPFAKDAKGETTDNLQLTIDKELDGHRLVKTLGESAKTWLADPQRVYPVIIDPSVVVSGTIAETEVQFGGLQRKLVYASNNWYAFYDESDVFYKKSSDGSTWGSAVDVDTADADNKNPSVWLEGTTIYVAWVDTGDTLATEFIEVNTINTASADALGTKCTSADLSSSAGDPSTITVSVAVADNSTVYLAATETGSGTLAIVFSLTFSGCTFTNITTSSGLTALDRPVVVTMGNNLQMIFQDGDLSQSMYNGTSWAVANTTIAAVTDNIYSVTTDETSLWVLSVSGTTATNFYSCPAFCDGDTWVDEADPWTGQTNLTSVSITYDSTNSDLYASVIKETDEKAFWKSTDATTIFWSNQTDFGWSGTGDHLGHISSNMSGAGPSQIGVVLRETNNFEFSAVPEKILFLLVGLPFLPKLLSKLKRKHKSF